MADTYSQTECNSKHSTIHKWLGVITTLVIGMLCVVGFAAYRSNNAVDKAAYVQLRCESHIAADESDKRAIRESLIRIESGQKALTIRIDKFLNHSGHIGGSK